MGHQISPSRAYTIWNLLFLWYYIDLDCHWNEWRDPRELLRGHSGRLLWWHLNLTGAVTRINVLSNWVRGTTSSSGISSDEFCIVVIGRSLSVASDQHSPYPLPLPPSPPLPTQVCDDTMASHPLYGEQCITHSEIRSSRCVTQRPDSRWRRRDRSTALTSRQPTGPTFLSLFSSGQTSNHQEKPRPRAQSRQGRTTLLVCDHLVCGRVFGLVMAFSWSRELLPRCLSIGLSNFGLFRGKSSLSTPSDRDWFSFSF